MRWKREELESVKLYSSMKREREKEEGEPRRGGKIVLPPLGEWGAKRKERRGKKER